MANFLSLPAELREQIYDEYLKIAPAHELSRLDILLASRKIYHEFGIRLYESTWFRVTRTEFPGLAYMDDSLRKSSKHIIFDVMSFCASKPDGAAKLLELMHSSGALPSNYKLVFKFGEYFGDYSIKEKAGDALQYVLREIMDNNEAAKSIQHVLPAASGVDLDNEPCKNREKVLVLADCCFGLMKNSMLNSPIFNDSSPPLIIRAQIGQRTEYRIRIRHQQSNQLARTVKMLPVLIVNWEDAYQDHNTEGSETYTPVSTSPFPGPVPKSISNVQIALVLASLPSSGLSRGQTDLVDLLERYAGTRDSAEN